MGIALDTDIVRPRGLGVRHAQSIMLFFALVLIYSMRVNMSMAIVDMTDVTKEDHFDWSYGVQSMILSSFFWGYLVLMLPSGELAKRFGGKVLLIISVFVNALLSLLLPTGAYLGGWKFVCACRILQGLTQSFVFPSTHHLVSQWIPPEEKGRLSTLIYAGIAPPGVRRQVACSMKKARQLNDKRHHLFEDLQPSARLKSRYSFVSHTTPLHRDSSKARAELWMQNFLSNFPISETLPPGYNLPWRTWRSLNRLWVGVGRCDELRKRWGYLDNGSQLGVALQLISSGFLASAWGWKAIFYTNGLLGTLWTVAYFMLGSASPEQSKLISEEELRYIQKSLGRVGEQKKHKTPWRKIITCLPFWAAVVAHCGNNWGFFTLMTEMPTYMANVLNVNLKQNGVLSSLPYLSMYVLSFPVGAMTDFLVRRKWLSVTNTRKLSNSIGLWGAAIALIGLSYTPEGNMVAAVVMLTVAVGINAGHYTGFMLILVDLAPNFSSSLMAVSNFFANIMSTIAPLICGLIIQDESDPSEWRKVFFLASAIYFAANLFFVLFTTSEKQPWNDPEEIDTETHQEKVGAK